MFRKALLFAMLVFMLGARVGAAAQANPHSVPIIDAEAGSCTAEMTVTDGAGKPIYDATIRVRISYGFMKMRKTDLEIGTNVDGKAKFIGLPDNLDQTLYFRAFKGNMKGSAFDNPKKHCHAEHSIVLHTR